MEGASTSGSEPTASNRSGPIPTATPARSLQFSPDVARPSYSAIQRSPPLPEPPLPGPPLPGPPLPEPPLPEPPMTEAMRTPRPSQVPGVGRSAGPWFTQSLPSALVRYHLSMRSASSSRTVSWRQAHICQPPPAATVTTGSFHAVSLSPGNTMRPRPVPNRSGETASTTSTHQCLDAAVEQLTNRRHVPSGAATRAGRSREAEPNWALVTSATVSKLYPSDERATTLAKPRPASTGRRNR